MTRLIRERRISAVSSTLARLRVYPPALAACLLAVVWLAPSGGIEPSPSTADAAAQSTLPPIRHVWVIVLENSSYNDSPTSSRRFDNGTSPYLDQLTEQGNLLTQYWATAHNSEPNYVAIVSGQAPTPYTQDDCGVDESSAEWQPPDPLIDPHGQAVGQGCTYPAKVKTLFDQLGAKGLTWKGYMEGLRNSTARDRVNCPTSLAGAISTTDAYVRKHDPIQWFHSLMDDNASCLAHDVPLSALARDLQTDTTTPNFSFIAPDIIHDGHEAGPATWAREADVFLRQYVPMITSSPAYRDGGLLFVTFDESETIAGVPRGPEDDLACCNEIPGPNSPSPGISGPGGGHIGGVALSPFIRAGTHTDTPYNHYSFLRSMEDLFGITGGDDGQGHLGFAGTYTDYPGPGSFGTDVYNGEWGSAPASPAAPSNPRGPREPDGSARWQHPLPQGNDLSAVDCPSSTVCLAAGDDGTLMRTTNGGDSWSALESGTMAALKGIACSGVQHCVAVGAAGTVVATIDGGDHWSLGDSGTDKSLNAVRCPVATVCFAVGDGGTALTSVDGGGTWAAQATNLTEPLYGLSCTAATACVAVGRSGKIATTNGVTWTERSSGLDQRLHSVSCGSATVCFAAGDSEAILRSSDGGATWTQLSTGSAALGNTYHSIACPSASVCLFAGKHDPVSVGPAANGSTGAALSITSDGGSGFAAQNPQTRNPLAAVSCPDVSTCVAVGARGTVLRTGDGGTTWSSGRGAPDVDLSRVVCWSAKLCGFEGMTILEEASCTGPSTCVAVGSDGAIMGTHDAGDSWATRKQGPPAPATGLAAPPLSPAALHGVDCAAGGACVAVGDLGAIQTSSDGGDNWSGRSSGTTRDLLGAACDDLGGCTAVGQQGTIVRSGDAGATWAAQESHTKALLSDVSCPSASTCVAVGAQGTVLTTTDGVGTWQAGSSGTDVYLDGVSCPTTSQCLAVGSRGTALVTVDGGHTWSPTDTKVGDDLMSIDCASAGHCVATGSLGTVISTADGGKSWLVQGTGTSRALRGVACPSATACFAVGDAAAAMGVTPMATASPDPGTGGGGTSPGGGGGTSPGGGGGTSPGGDTETPGGDLGAVIRKIRGTIRIKPDRRFRGKHTRTARAHRGATRTFLVRFENAGTGLDGMRLRGCRSSAGFSVRYFAGTADVSGRIQKGKYRLLNLRPGATRTIAMRVRAGKHARVGAVESCRVGATSISSPKAADAVRGEVTVVGPNRPRRPIR